MLLIKLIIANILKHLVIIHKGSMIAKFKSVFLLSFFSSFPYLMNVVLEITFGMKEIFSEWITDNGGYLFFVLVAVGIDHFLGSWVHAFIKKDFTIKKNVFGLLSKIFLVISAGVLFEGFQYIYTEDNFITEYLTLITRLMVFLYPTGSALMNCAIITNGKFPPVALLRKLTRFNETLDLNEFKNNGDEDI